MNYTMAVAIIEDLYLSGTVAILSPGSILVGELRSGRISTASGEGVPLSSFGEGIVRVEPNVDVDHSEPGSVFFKKKGVFHYVTDNTTVTDISK